MPARWVPSRISMSAADDGAPGGRGAPKSSGSSVGGPALDQRGAGRVQVWVEGSPVDGPGGRWDERSFVDADICVGAESHNQMNHLDSGVTV